MQGPFQLAHSVIDAIVKQPGPAIYLLRRIEETIEYAYYRGLVGRTGGHNLDQALKEWLDSDYRVFWYEYLESEDEAFERQCLLWHELEGPAGKLDNEQHPKSANSYSAMCPICMRDFEQ